MVRFSILSTAFLAGTATASPTFLDARSPPTSAKSTAECTVDDTSSTQAVQKILDSSGVNEWLDKKLETMHGEHDWVNKLWLNSFPKEGKSPLSGCGTVGSTCDPSIYCSDYPSPQAYWAFTAVSVLHSKITYIHDKLLWKGWLDGLSIDQIGKDFSVAAPDFTWFKWVAAAFSMATGGATTVGIDQSLRGMAGLAAGGFTAASTYKPSGNTIDTASVKNTIKNIIGTVGDYVSDILANATGNGDADALPYLNQNTLFTHATAQFYEDSTLLLDENKDNSSFIAAFDGFTEHIEKKLVDVSLKSGYYMLLAEESLTKGDCKDTYGAHWLEAKKDQYRCFYLTAPSTTSGCKNQDPKTCQSDSWQGPGKGNHQMGHEIYDKLADDYNFDLEGYFKSLIDCHFNGNGEVDMTGFKTGIPRCFYTLHVSQGTWHGSGDTSWDDLALYGF